MLDGGLFDKLEEMARTLRQAPPPPRTPWHAP